MNNNQHFNPDIELDYRFNSMFHLQSTINEVELEIKDFETDLLMMVSATPKDIFNSESDILFELRQQFEDKMEIIKDKTITLYKLYLYQEYAEENKLLK
jgi:hypothetical protein